MPDRSDKVYRFASLAGYSFRERVLIRIADLAFYILISLIGRTVRIDTEGLENVDAIERSGRLPIYALWHDRIFLGTYFLKRRGIVFLTSQSYDGEYIARFIQRFGFGAIRGSSTRGGAKGLVEMIRGMKRGLPMGFTVDGPKGPRYVAKSGAILLAKKTGNPILPFLVEPRRFWIIKSWDRLRIPRPFTHARVAFGEPIYVEAESTGDTLIEKLAELQRSLDDLVERGREWRESK